MEVVGVTCIPIENVRIILTVNYNLMYQFVHEGR